jgi:hypothetical protein
MRPLVFLRMRVFTIMISGTLSTVKITIKKTKLTMIIGKDFNPIVLVRLRTFVSFVSAISCIKSTGMIGSYPRESEIKLLTC